MDKEDSSSYLTPLLSQEPEEITLARNTSTRSRSTGSHNHNQNPAEKERQPLSSLPTNYDRSSRNTSISSGMTNTEAGHDTLTAEHDSSVMSPVPVQRNPKGHHHNSNKRMVHTDQYPNFPVDVAALSKLANEHSDSRHALADLLLDAAEVRLRDEQIDEAKEMKSVAEALRDKERGIDRSIAEDAAVLLTKDILYSDVEYGLCKLKEGATPNSDDQSGSGSEGDHFDEELEYRKEIFGANAIAEKEFDSFLHLCWEALHDFVLVMLIVLGVVSIVIETTIGNEADHCTTCWVEGFAILTSVCIVTLVTAGIDYTKQEAYVKLTRTLDRKNVKLITRNGKQMLLPDAEIVVGDIINVNSHNLATIPADCLLLGPLTEPLKMNEASLTGESELVSKYPGDVILSGTNAVEGTGKMIVIAVGVNSVAGKIKARVYADGTGDDLDSDEDSPLTQKLDHIAKQIGLGGTVAAVIAFTASTILGLVVEGEDIENLVDYFIVAVTVLAVAVPEGLPVAVTLSLALSSNKMMNEQNLVKHLDACETMGCATTICTDKTGTLTTNRMTARSFYGNQTDCSPTNASESLGDHISSKNVLSKETIELIANSLAIATMNETSLNSPDASGIIHGGIGNPTEVALLLLVHELGFNYQQIRDTTPGRSGASALIERLQEGKCINFTSGRKMMSWVIPKESGGYRLYCKGAADVLLTRCVKIHLDLSGEEDIQSHILNIQSANDKYSRRGMRTLAIAFRDIPEDDFPDLNDKSSSVNNSDGTPALLAETNLVFLGLIGIEDPLRSEVPGAIEKCYHAGIDVRMVTGDAPNTAVSIAYQAGILRDEHFFAEERVAKNLRPNVLMEGKMFRQNVYRIFDDGRTEFDQMAFDHIWPHLRVLARSSPDDKLTLAHGLNQSTLFQNESKCNELKKEFNIRVFPDRQVVAMTGDGTNDAPALKRADIGFAMGIAGTQIAKDAADIILLDDNFASIVTAAKWGRNVYASIQKFLQFQLTVNLSAVTTALVGAFAYQQSPLAAIQLLWVNLIMDSLASLALASEPPIDDLLEADPVNRSQSMITERMFFNMIGQATYQVCVVMVILFEGPDIWGYKAGDQVEQDDSLYEGYIGENSEHYTMIFNAFVWMQLFNEINCRHLHGEINVFEGLFRNKLFCFIWIITAVLQVIMVQFGSHAIHVKEDGLNGEIWGYCILFGLGSFPIQQIINCVYKLTRDYRPWRRRRNRATAGSDRV